MFCSRCGKELEGDYRFCPSCDNSVSGVEAPRSQSREAVLLTFGPFGVSVCDGPYSMFKWQRKNTNIVEVTDKRIRIIPNKSLGFLKIRSLGGNAFDIPFSSVKSIDVYPHPAHLGLMKVLDIQYRDGNRTVEKSICGYSGNIERTHRLMECFLRT